MPATDWNLLSSRYENVLRVVAVGVCRIVIVRAATLIATTSPETVTADVGVVKSTVLATPDGVRGAGVGVDAPPPLLE